MNIQQFWQDVLVQDADALRGWFWPDAVIRWHCSNEQFTLEEYIRANCEYPGSWEGVVERTETIGALVITAVRIFPCDRRASFHVVSFLHLRDGRIDVMDEYWADDGTPPQWRRDMHIGRPLDMGG